MPSNKLDPAGGRGVDGRRPDDQLLAIPATAAPNLRQTVTRIRDVQEQVAEVRLGRVAFELVDLAEAAILAGRPTRIFVSVAPTAAPNCALFMVSGSGRVRVASKLPNVVLLVIGVEHVRHAVTGSGERAAGGPTTSSLPTIASASPNTSPAKDLGRRRRG